jgi:hypothetical protein
MSRTLTRARRLLAPWLLVLAAASAAAAAPPAPRHKASTLCRPHTTLKKLLLRMEKVGGPLAQHPFSLRSKLMVTKPLLQRATRARVGDDDEAIQNDAPAARIDFDDAATPILRPVAVLSTSFDRLSVPDLFSPRSPRGPPGAI